jgi:membrane associated rhomboid family serine protease
MQRKSAGGYFSLKSSNMGLYDRDYTQENYRSQYSGAPPMRFASSHLSPVVKWLLILNAAVFLATFLVPAFDHYFLEWFSVHPTNVGRSLQLWRLITYQFLHGGPWHLFVNMLALFFFGPMLERFWGSRRFLVFYLVCGMTGGILYPLLVLAGWLNAAYLVGASGSILGMLAAGAMLFPNLTVYMWGIFPLRLVTLAIILAGISIITLLRPDRFANAGGEAAHLAGMVTGAVYVFSQPWRAKLMLRIRSGGWEKKMAAQRKLQVELDRILQKVHDSGIHSLTSKEKKILKQATEAEQRRYTV